ncbi:uncharacterized protein PAN0_042c6362 [Moesziomyces antarcticus]|uniref:Uncharacterized protein n=1 Tax=Pseudozyma antarctica TaxID=84753 RepID=A0A081CN82_PSEA2|nr:uncharacterized protein PAN0_042c6362 [Moesziomyces antarcticus]GAK68128.1 hypothetical protein PAN0_042c6362 [Moesziomyces antarcticus]
MSTLPQDRSFPAVSTAARTSLCVAYGMAILFKMPPWAWSNLDEMPGPVADNRPLCSPQGFFLSGTPQPASVVGAAPNAWFVLPPPAGGILRRAKVQSQEKARGLMALSICSMCEVALGDPLAGSTSLSLAKFPLARRTDAIPTPLPSSSLLLQILSSPAGPPQNSVYCTMREDECLSMIAATNTCRSFRGARLDRVLAAYRVSCFAAARPLLRLF